MLQIRIHGRGGQGAQKAGQILATAFFREGKYVQAFATYGGARRGTAVSCFLRIDDRPVRLRCDITSPDAILCFDASLLDQKLLAGAGEKTLVLINSTRPPEAFKEYCGLNIFTIDAKAIAGCNGLGRIVNSALLGALAALMGSPGFQNLQSAIEEMSPVKMIENVASCLDGYERARLMKGAV